MLVLTLGQYAAFGIYLPLQGAVRVAGLNLLALRVVSKGGFFTIALPGFQQSAQGIARVA